MERAVTLEVVADVGESPLAHARLHRQLTIDEAARRASVAPEELQWLEEGRHYRFPTPDRAIAVALLVATALEVEHREALELAGLPTPPLRRSSVRRIGALVALLAVVAAAALTVVLAERGSRPKVSATGAAESSLPAPWTVKVLVLNGSGDIVYTRSVASRIQALSYRIEHVGRASSFDYVQTAVYFPPGGEAVCTHLAQQLGVPVQPLPGGNDPRRCVVIVGPERGPGS
jgi:LytR cell envelope-related transcriptional attenuator